MITTNNPNRQDAKPLSLEELNDSILLLNTICKSPEYFAELQRLIDNYQNLQHFYDAVGAL